MKRSIAALAIALTIALAANSQSIPDINSFGTAFGSFTNDLAGSLAVNSTIGSNWSDAYIGGFPPHFGVGVTTGAAFVAVDNATTLFNALGANIPSALKGLGIPIPAAVATLKIGIPFLPIDVGVKGGYIPSSVGGLLKSSTGASFDYANIGLQVRYALLKQNLVLPNVSVGLAYDYQKGSVTAPTGLPSQTFSVPTSSSSSTTITAESPQLALGWQTNVFDFTVQVSKQLLIFVPYLGAGYTLGLSSVTGGISSQVSTSYAGGIAGINDYLASIGGPTLSDQGFTYTAKANSPVLRVYGGLSLRIIVLDFDTQVMYVPSTKSLGASLTARVQI